MNRHDDALKLLVELTSAGFRIRTEGDRLKISPPTVPDDLRARITANRDELIRAVRLEQQRANSPSSLDALRLFAPSLWTLVQVSDGRFGLVWGVTPHGVLVSLGLPAPILTLNPADVKLT